MKEITRDEIYKLYYGENKTDKEIAQLYHVNAFNISQLRKKHGIKGINARHRRFIDKPQSPISSRQMEIIMGSLLGDGCLKSNRGISSYLSISHTIKQKEYTDWLYSELENICLSPPKQYISKGKYITYYFMSEARKDLQNLRDKIYTPNKSISQWWLDQISELGLAIWYMDDGSLIYVNKNKSMFNFATNSFSQEENYMLSNMLKERFDILSEVKPYNKKSGIQYNINISEESFEKFNTLISKYLTPDLQYKATGNINKEHLALNIECKIDKNTIDRLYNKEGFTQEQIAGIFNVHKSTIRKYMDLFDIKTREISEAQLNGKNNKCERTQNGQFIPLRLDKCQEEKANALFNEIKSKGFPYPPIKDSNHYIAIIDRMYNLKSVDVTDGIVDKYLRSGLEICSSYCPQIFDMHSFGSLSPMQIFNDDELFKDCIRRTIKYAKKDTVNAVRQGLKTYRKNRCVTSFPPMWAKTILNNFYKNESNLSLLDFSCGFGGRLIGSYCSKNILKYTGIDPIETNIQSNVSISRLIDEHAELRNNEFKSNFICGTAEDNIPILDDQYDVIMTSPPYFNKEIYSKDLTQCQIKYNEYNQWKDNWFLPVLSMAYDRLKIGGKMIVFASNYNRFTIGEDCKSILKNISSFNPICIKFALPSLEYFRSKDIKRFDYSWAIEKI